MVSLENGVLCIGVWPCEVYFLQETLILQLLTQTVPHNHSTCKQGECGATNPNQDIFSILHIAVLKEPGQHVWCHGTCKITRCSRRLWYCELRLLSQSHLQYAHKTFANTESSLKNLEAWLSHQTVSSCMIYRTKPHTLFSIEHSLSLRSCVFSLEYYLLSPSGSLTVMRLCPRADILITVPPMSSAGGKPLTEYNLQYVNTSWQSCSRMSLRSCTIVTHF